MAFFSRWLDPLRGAGRHAITVPPMDGALQPNEAIEEAPLVCALAAPDALLARGAQVFAASQARLFALDPAGASAPRQLVELSAEIVCAALSEAGVLAVGLADGRVTFRRLEPSGAVVAAPFRDFSDASGVRLNCPTALTWADEATLIVCNGSQQNGPSDWKRDLTERGATGSIWRVKVDGGEARRLAGGLAYPNGLLPQADGSLIVSEAWASRLIRIAEDGRVSAVLSDLPGYPAGLAKRSAGGAWLAVFAPRSQLFEFMLRERELREQMMREIDPEYWMAPALRPARSFLEPLQGGALKQLGIMKPWAPSRSYGLVLALDADLRPEDSAHSRANGLRHGIRSLVEQDGKLLVASKGGDAIVALALNAKGAFA